MAHSLRPVALVAVAAFAAWLWPASAHAQRGTFFTLVPCRLYDSRSGPPLASATVHVIPLAGVCGVSAGSPPGALSLNATVVSPTGAGHLQLYPDAAPAQTSAVNFTADQTRANNVVVALAADGSGDLRAVPTVVGGGTLHLILDINGYFVGACGDLRISDAEECDGSVVAGATCEALRSPAGGYHCPGWAPGQQPSGACLSCRGPNAVGDPDAPPACRHDTGGCTTFCGDQVKAGSEGCDGTDFGGATCATLLGPCTPGPCDPPRGQPSCTTVSCQVVTSNCSQCGNGIREAAEQCDPLATPTGCSAGQTCRFPSVGHPSNCTCG